ncbi:maturation control protein [Salmonella enterica]
MNQKIAVITLTTDKPMYITAMLSGDNLIMSAPKSLPGSLEGQRQKLTPAIAKLRKSGFKVLVDETSGAISAATGASHVSLKSRFNDGRAAVVVGIERYNEMRLQKTISLPSKNAGAYDIPASIVDIEFNAKGEEVYRINWPDIRPEHILTILCCYATVYHPVASADYINAMTGAAEEKPRDGLLQTFSKLVSHQHITSATAVPATLAGTRISDDEVVL